MFSRLKERCFIWLTNYLPDKETSDNAWYSVIDGMFYTIMTGLTSPFMSLFAMNLGATDPMLSYLSSWPSLIGLIAQVPSAVITERLKQLKKSLLIWAFVHRFNYLIYAVLPFLPIAGISKAWLFIILVTTMNFPAVVVNTMWTQLMGKLFTGRDRARVFGDRNFLTSIVTLVFLLISGSILDIIPFPYNFSVIFGIGFLALMLSLYYLGKLQEPPAPEKAQAARDEKEKDKEKEKRSPWSGIGIVLKDRPFLLLSFALFVMHIGFGLSGALWTIFYRRQLFLSNTEIARISIISTASSVIWYRFVPRVMDRIGNKSSFLLSIAFFAPVPFLNTFVNPAAPWLLWAIAILDGMASATYNLSSFNVILESATDENNRPSYLAFFNTCNSLAGVIFPIVGMRIYAAMGSVDVRPVFMISSAVRLIAVIMFAVILSRGRNNSKDIQHVTES